MALTEDRGAKRSGLSFLRGVGGGAPIVIGLAIFCIALVATSAARADDAPKKSDTDDSVSESWLRYIERRHTIALVEAGIIVLPFAPISQSQKGGDLPIFNVPVGQGDATIQLGIHILYRPTRDWSFGANFLFDPQPTADTEYGGLSGLARTHSRAYFSSAAKVATSRSTRDRSKASSAGKPALSSSRIASRRTRASRSPRSSATAR